MTATICAPEAAHQAAASDLEAGRARLAAAEATMIRLQPLGGPEFRAALKEYVAAEQTLPELEAAAREALVQLDRHRGEQSRTHYADIGAPQRLHVIQELRAALEPLMAAASRGVVLDRTLREASLAPSGPAFVTVVEAVERVARLLEHIEQSEGGHA